MFHVEQFKKGMNRMKDLEQTNETRSMMKGSYQDNKLDKSNEFKRIYDN